MAESRTQVHIFSPSEKMTEEYQRAVEALSQESVLALDSEGVNLGKDGPLTLLQIGTLSGTVYLFDVMRDEMKQDKAYFKDTGLDEFLTSKETTKVIQSCAGDSAALYHQFGIRLENIFDTQVAHLVIEEHKGRLLPSRIKLEEICQKYSEHATVYEGKDHLKDIWTKKEGNFWAKRPMTKEMIEYASCDVTALIPEVFETQKRYIDAHDLWGKYQQRVQEEIDFYIDPTARERRLQRNIKMRDSILNSMSAKYQLGLDFNLISDEDGKKAIEGISLKELHNFPELVRDLKKQAIQICLRQLEDDLSHPDTFEPQRNLTAQLNEIEHCDDAGLKSEAVRLKAKVTDMVSRDIERKYDRNTSVEVLTVTEMNVLRWLKPLSKDEPPHGPTVIMLHWRVIERDIDENLRALREDPDYEVHFPISKMRFLVSNQQVPGNIREKARSLLDAFESAIANRIERKYTRSTQVSEISEMEKIVLAKLFISSKSYGPVVKSLHWKVTFENLCKEIEDYRQGNMKVTDGYLGRIGFLANNQSVPLDVKEKAREFQKILPRRQSRRR